ncbi:hypothetical protein PG994_003906 [Apiospora phragmitis]|uniref:Uncharacterized protein n=1 Tax=Apiospora phragmitis TaxID=2905665 RepID=A0ABR1VZF8_9PEZI
MFIPHRAAKFSSAGPERPDSDPTSWPKAEARQGCWPPVGRDIDGPPPKHDQGDPTAMFVQTWLRAQSFCLAVPESIVVAVGLGPLDLNIHIKEAWCTISILNPSLQISSSAFPTTYNLIKPTSSTSSIPTNNNMYARTAIAMVFATLATFAAAAPLNINLGAYSPALVVGDGALTFEGEGRKAEGAAAVGEGIASE